MAVKKTIEIDVRTEGAVQDVEKLTTSINQADRQTQATKETTDTLVNSLDNMTGGAITAFRGIVSGAKSGVVAMKSLKVAIAATGIGLLVVAVGSLITYFTQTERGAEAVEKAFAAIGATINVLKDRVSSFGEGLSLIFQGKFEEGAKKLAGSMIGVANEIRKEATAAYSLTEALQAVEDKEIGLIVTQAKRRASIEALRLAAEDETKTEKERQDALKKSIDLQNQITNDEIAIAKERARISAEQLALGESTDEEIRESNELQAKVIELEGQRDRSVKRLTTRLNAFGGSQKDANKGVDEAVKRAKELLEFENKLVKQREDLNAKSEAEKLALEQQRAQAELDNLIATETQKKEAQIALDSFYQQKFDELALERQEREDEKQREEDAKKRERGERLAKEEEERRQKELEDIRAFEEAKVDIQNYSLDVAVQGIRLFQDLAGENKTLQKALLIAESAAGIAKIVINTNAANAAAIAKYSLIPGGQALSAAEITLNKISAGIGIASTIAATAKGLQALGGGGAPSAGGSLNNSGGGRGQQAATPNPSFNIVGNNQANQLGQAISRQDSPVRAYVVSREMTDQQEMDRNIRRTASVG